MGGPIGLPVWIEAVQQDERRKKLGLDALVACYLMLRGPDGLDLIDNRFLKNPHAEYTHIYSTIMALRFHGDENTGVVPRERLLASMRLLLEQSGFRRPGDSRSCRGGKIGRCSIGWWRCSRRRTRRATFASRW